MPEMERVGVIILRFRAANADSVLIFTRTCRRVSVAYDDFLTEFADDVLVVAERISVLFICYEPEEWASVPIARSLLELINRWGTTTDLQRDLDGSAPGARHRIFHLESKSLAVIGLTIKPYCGRHEPRIVRDMVANAQGL
jgi:hypothetical protein